MRQKYISAAVEGDPDEAVARKLAETVGLEISAVHGKKGKGYLDQKAAAFNAAARFGPWLILRDLDNDAPCPGELVHRLLARPSRHMMLRIAVRSVESWVLADKDAFRRFMGIASARVPDRPDDLPNPKGTLVGLARTSRYSDMAPDPGAPNSVGPAYNARLIEFIMLHWRPRVAARNSESLRRCLAKLDAL